jgi:carboxymethylenebutenolidase
LPDVDKLDLGKITAPILAHFAGKDDWAKPEKARALKAKLDGLGKPMELHVYEEAGHAFNRDSDANVYNAGCAKTAWERTTAFLGKHVA